MKALLKAAKDGPVGTMSGVGAKAAKTRVTARRGVQSISVGATLLEAMAAAKGPLPLSELAAAAGMTPQKAHRYLLSLIAAGLAERDTASGKYDLGGMSLRLGLAALNRRTSVRRTTEAALEFGQTHDLTVAVGVWSDHGPTLIAWHDSTMAGLCNFGVGSVMQLLRSATGRLFLSFMPRELTRPFVERELQLIATYAPTERIRTLPDVNELIRQVRATRLGSTHEDLVPNLSAIAAPVFNHQGRLVASIMQMGPSSQIHSESSPASRRLLELANAVSTRLGFDVSQPSEVEVVEAARVAKAPSGSA